MRKIKRVLDLHTRGLSQRAIAGSCGIAQSTVSEYLAAAAVLAPKLRPGLVLIELALDLRLIPLARLRPSHSGGRG